MNYPTITTQTSRHMCTDFILQCREFCDHFENAFEFSQNGDLLCNRQNREAAVKLMDNPRVRFFIELVTGASGVELKFIEPNEGEAEQANAKNNVTLTQWYGLLYTFYCRMCQADGRQPKL